MKPERMLEAIVDTNLIVAIIFRHHEKHCEALKEWKDIDKAYLPLVCVSEIAYFFIKNSLNLEILNEVLNDPKIEIVQNTNEDVYYTLRNKEAVKGYDDFNDLLILSVAGRLNLRYLPLTESSR
ncbi:PIN domain-containing protein [Sulfuracidifex tepidarius]|uniref:PIN domain-containing protein n=1 Tax=Sulfuracidifex tepidarius TaxID=1294262 RepID=A0A510E692_9CREN|nr:PIN domain-containing protein [Sulfuracidifex tepidarius]BBG25203.1 hypothetical protein IC006_2538 [Sulfuracidifex tepidarius]BBG27996.1 hypothetical protein IC007_2551 [Sulfuracidifex tepidarius]